MGQENYSGGWPRLGLEERHAQRSELHISLFFPQGIFQILNIHRDGSKNTSKVFSHINVFRCKTCKLFFKELY